jgi:hypothetical protein
MRFSSLFFAFFHERRVSAAFFEFHHVAATPQFHGFGQLAGKIGENGPENPGKPQKRVKITFGQKLGHQSLAAS